VADISDISAYVRDLCVQAKRAADSLANAPSHAKNRALQLMAEAIRGQADSLAEKNRLDLDAARQAGLPSAMIDRLTLTPKRIESMASGIDVVRALPDPVGEVIWGTTRPNGLRILKVRVPLGVIGFIYESRPNVTADAAALCLRAGNAIILRGGKEAIHSNIAIASLLAQAVEKAGLDPGSVLLVETTDRAAVGYMLKADEFIDVIIPRGGESLIRRIAEESSIPVIKHYAGICHTFVHADADLDMALDICLNAKLQRPGVCNAMETLLVDEAAAAAFLPMVLPRLREGGCEIRGDEKICAFFPEAVPAREQNRCTEYLDLVLSVRIVPSLDEAIMHINTYGSSHSDAIVTQNYAAAMRFVREVDSATVYVNASTRFTDGGEFGMGAEVGISTDKLHARGPMGLPELTTYKFIIFGDGQVRT